MRARRKTSPPSSEPSPRARMPAVSHVIDLVDIDQAVEVDRHEDSGVVGRADPPAGEHGVDPVFVVVFGFFQEGGRGWVPGRGRG